MSARIVRLVMLPFTLVVILLLGSARAMSEAPASTSLPRTADGQPDIHGYWFHTVSGSALNGWEACYCDDDPEYKHSHNTVARKSLISDPPDGKVPYQPWAEARYKEVHDQLAGRSLEDLLEGAFPVKPEYVDPQLRCAPAGLPAVHGHLEPFQILQPKGQVVFLYQYPRSLHRGVPLDGRPHVGKNVPLWMGDSRGRWEGNTLVVDITNTNPQTWFDKVGSFHSDALLMVERFTFADIDTLQYQATITDPKVFTRPWTVALELRRQKNEQVQFVVESECNERGNPDLYGILRVKHPKSVGKGWVERQ